MFLNPTPESHGQKSLVGYRLRGHRVGRDGATAKHSSATLCPAKNLAGASPTRFFYVWFKERKIACRPRETPGLLEGLKVEKGYIEK